MKKLTDFIISKKKSPYIFKYMFEQNLQNFFGDKLKENIYQCLQKAEEEDQLKIRISEAKYKVYLEEYL